MVNKEDIELMQIIDETDKVLEAIFSFYENVQQALPEEERQKMLYL